MIKRSIVGLCILLVAGCGSSNASTSCKMENSKQTLSILAEYDDENNLVAYEITKVDDVDTSLFCKGKGDDLCVDENTYQEQLEESNTSLEKPGVTIESIYDMKTKKSTQIYTVNVDKAKKSDYSVLGIPKNRDMKTFLKQLKKVGYSCEDE